MPNDPTQSDHPSIGYVMPLMRRLWPERVLAREARNIRKALLAGLPRPGEPDLSTPEGRRTLTSVIWSASEIRTGAAIRTSPVVAASVKVALAIDDLLAGRTHLVTSRSFVRIADDVCHPLPLPLAQDGPSNDAWATVSSVSAAPVEFALPWRPSPNATGQRLGVATAHVRLNALNPADAPVACSLWTPEGRLEVRRHGEVWLRPVLSPGSWAPITSGRFREAAASGEAWRDSPFLPHTGRCSPTFHLSDYASPRAVAKGDGRRIEEARALCLARARWLCTVGDVVHRMTDEPLAGIATVFVDEDVHVGPAWSLGDLDSTCRMDVADCYEGDNGHWALGRPYRARPGDPPCRRGFVSLANWIAAVEVMTPFASEHHVDHFRSWPRPDELVRLEPASRDETDGPAALGAAAALSPRVLWLSGREAVRLDVIHELGALDRAIGVLHAAEAESTITERMLTDVEALATEVSEALRGTTDPNNVLWAYVAALATHAAKSELMSRRPDDEGLNSLQF